MKPTLSEKGRELLDDFSRKRRRTGVLEGGYGHEDEVKTEAAFDAAHVAYTTLSDYIAGLEKKLELAISGVEHIKKHELWGVVANCDAVLDKLREP